MSEHVGDWLSPYADGELDAARARQVEEHLAACPACGEALGELRQLSSLLQASFPAATPTPPARFVAQVMQRLPARPEKPAWKRALGIGWRLVPLGLLGGWAFGQAVLVVSGVVLAVLGAVPGAAAIVEEVAGLHSAGWLALVAASASAGPDEMLRAAALALSWAEPFAWLATLNMVLLIGATVLLWSWLASWWARRRSRSLAAASARADTW